MWESKESDIQGSLSSNKILIENSYWKNFVAIMLFWKHAFPLEHIF